MLVLQYGTKLPEHEEDGPMMGIPAQPGQPKSDSGARAAKMRGAAAGSDSTAAHDSTATGKGGRGGKDGNGGSYVVSGMVRGENEIVGEGAVFDVPVRKGRVIAFTFDPMHRYLNHHEFPMVWNAILNWNDRPAARGEAATAAGARQ